MITRQTSKKRLKELTYEVTGAAIEVHKELGPGLLESVYHRCMKHELNLRGVSYRSEVLVCSNYKGIALEAELRCDFLIEELLVLELKAVEGILPVHDAQVLSYMKLLRVAKGVLINFYSDNIYKSGQRTYVNEIFKTLPEL